MQIEVSKTNWENLMSLIDKSVSIIQNGNPSCKDYNVARRLRQTKNTIVRLNDKFNDKRQ